MALHESAKHADPKISGAAVDTHAAAPIACFTYTQGLGMQIVTVHLAYTKPPEKPKNGQFTGKNRASHLLGACGALQTKHRHPR
jgi:hypothetical protein